jgi:hypothetical protein
MPAANTGARLVGYERTSAIEGLIAAVAMFAGDLVSIVASSGLVNLADKASGTAEQSWAIGVLTQDVAAGGVCSIATQGTIMGLSSKTVGKRQLLGTSGALTETVPTTAGDTYQCVGFAINATTVRFNITPPVFENASGTTTVRSF